MQALLHFEESDFGIQIHVRILLFSQDSHFFVAGLNGSSSRDKQKKNQSVQGRNRRDLWRLVNNSPPRPSNPICTVTSQNRMEDESPVCGSVSEAGDSVGVGDCVGSGSICSSTVKDTVTAFSSSSTTVNRCSPGERMSSQAGRRSISISILFGFSAAWY